MFTVPSNLCFIFLFHTLVGSVAAVAENRTIDDQNGDSHTFERPKYSPDNVWEGKNCTTCPVSPDESKAYDGNWSAATYLPNEMSSLNISFPFEGTSLYVYFILANNQGVGITEYTAVNFTLDGKHAGNFTHFAENGKGMQYDQPVYSVTGLKQERHDFLIDTSGPKKVWVNFDYAIYTYDNSSKSDFAPKTGHPKNATETGDHAIPTNSQIDDNVDLKTPAGTIVGVSIGGFVFLGLGAIILRYCSRRRSANSMEHAISPFFVNASPSQPAPRPTHTTESRCLLPPIAPSTPGPSIYPRDRKIRAAAQPPQADLERNPIARGRPLPGPETDKRQQCQEAFQQMLRIQQAMAALHTMETEHHVPLAGRPSSDLPPGYTPTPGITQSMPS